jgi:hypothetical protein
MHYYGVNKDIRDERDILHRPVLTLPELPRKVDLSKFLPIARTQMSLNSCYGFCTAANVTASARQAGVQCEWVSPRWIWDGGRQAGGTMTQNAGVYPRYVLDFIVKNGVVLESECKYGPLDIVMPNSGLILKAKKRPILRYVRCDEGVEGICSALAAGHFVSLASPWPVVWENAFFGKLAVITGLETLAGYHGTVLHGFDSGADRTLGMNSWSWWWGMLGKFSMPMSAFEVFKKAYQGYDAQYIVVDKWV